MNTINLGAASWTLARAQLRLEVAASALLDAHDLALKDPEDLRRNDTWIDKGHNFHFSFHISFNGLPSSFGALNADTGSDFIALALTQAPVGWVRSNVASANDDRPVLVAVTPCSLHSCTGCCHR